MMFVPLRLSSGCAAQWHGGFFLYARLMRLNPAFLLALFFLAAPLSVPAQEQACFSELWGDPAKPIWAPGKNRLPDFTNVGYKGGTEPIPDWPVGVNVTDFGAIPNDGRDDSQAFIDAIAACPDYHAVLVPKGEFTIEKQVVPGRDHFVLRGEDMYETILFFPKYLGEMDIREIGMKTDGSRSVVQGAGFFDMNGGTEKSIENLTFQFREQRKNGVWEYLGAIPFSFTGGVTDSWIRNVRILNYDLGGPVSGSNLSYINLIFDQFIGRRSLDGSAPGKAEAGTVSLDEYGEPIKYYNFDALFGIMPRTAKHCLFHNIEVRGLVMQPFDLNESSHNNVYSKIRTELRAVGYHGGSSKFNLYTDMNSYIVKPGGERMTDMTHWGVDFMLPESVYLKAGGNDIFVGYGDDYPEKITDTFWYEPIDPVRLEPRNLYLAQLAYFNKPLPEAPPSPEPSPYDGEVFRILPVEDKDPSRMPNEGLSINESYFKFDLKNIDEAKVARARLRVSLVDIRGTPFELTAWGVEDDHWTETALTPGNTPELGTELDSVLVGEGEENPVLEFDVTPFVREQWVNGDGIISLCIKKSDGEGQLVFLRSMEGAMRPELIIEREPDPVPNPPTAPKGIRSQALVGNIILDWDDNPETDVASYTVYRNPVSVPKDLERTRMGYKESYASGLVTSDFVDIQSSGNWRVGMMDHRLVYRYKITAVDAHGYESPRSLEFVAATLHPSNNPPAFSETPKVPHARAGTEFSASLATTASDPESDPLYFMKVSGPDWLEVALDGTLSGTPGTDDIGSHPATFQVTAIGGSEVREMDIAVDQNTR